MKNRTIALYRASTKQQIAANGQDIPVQRKIVQDYIFSHNLNLIREFAEGGVSGFKNLRTEREAIVTILEMAKNKEFDILVIYHSNRLGRLHNDTPLVIKQLNEDHVKVISVIEGELKTRTPMDRYVNNIRSIGNEQESALKSELISDYHIAMVEEGRYRGGAMLPFGYKLQDAGSRNYKGRHILDFVIDENEAQIVRMIYNMSISDGYGQARIAKKLNELNIKSKKGGIWTNSGIGSILNNPIYKGYFRMKSKVRGKEVLSPQQNELIIIPELEWEQNQIIMKKRQFTSDTILENDNRNKNIYGKMLLNGIAYCGYCGHSLTTMTVYARWTTKDGIKHKTGDYRYRCGSFFKKGGVKCNGQSTYSRGKIDNTVLSGVYEFVAQLQGKTLESDFFERLDERIEDVKNESKSIQNDIAVAYNDLKMLKKEVVKVLAGKSSFTEELLTETIEEQENSIKRFEQTLKENDEEIIKLMAEKETYISYNKGFENWISHFERADLEHKRLMLSKILDRVNVYRDRTELIYREQAETFRNNSKSSVR